MTPPSFRTPEFSGATVSSRQHSWQFYAMASTDATLTEVAVEETNQVYTDQELLMELFMAESGLEPDEELAASAVGLLIQAKITKAWQLKKLSDRLLEKI